MTKIFFDTIPIIQIKEDKKTEEIFIKKDKFGKEWRDKNKKHLDQKIEEANKKPFVATDKFGQSWECQNQFDLDNFINKQNEYYNYLYNQQYYSNYCTGPTCNRGR